MFLILSVIIGLIGLTAFLAGLLLGLLELWELVPTIFIVVIGIVFMLLAAIVWLRLLPGRLLYALQWTKSTSSSRNRQRPFGIIGVLDLNNINNNKTQTTAQPLSLHINPESTETLLKSIRGATYLIQAIQYSLETNIMSEMGQSVINSSVIHTAPGCTNVLDCQSEDEQEFTQPAASPRLSGPEEQWCNTDHLRWTNQQLNISLNKTSSSLNVFPYSESRPLDELTVNDAASTDDLAGSTQSGISRVTVSYNSAKEGGGEIRCIGRVQQKSTNYVCMNCAASPNKGGRHLQGFEDVGTSKTGKNIGQPAKSKRSAVATLRR
ncbi:hypothetical protein M3Y97_00235500 [Aphelenchoides bicaudatus]|nr:hypothetical protein M3Y97_00235500 [Aphelenchoides bicaudatus]